MDFSKLEQLMDSFVNEGYAPGNTIKVCLDNKVVYDYSCGYSDIDKKIKMNGDEYFNLYSCSKITTVTAALQLLEKGVISPDIDVMQTSMSVNMFCFSAFSNIHTMSKLLGLDLSVSDEMKKRADHIADVIIKYISKADSK